jgi:hypothetical protein
LGMRCMHISGRQSPAATKELRQWLQQQLRVQHCGPVLLTDAAVSLLVTSVETVGLTRPVRLRAALPMLSPVLGLDAASTNVSDIGLQVRPFFTLDSYAPFHWCACMSELQQYRDKGSAHCCWPLQAHQWRCLVFFCSGQVVTVVWLPS